MIERGTFNVSRAIWTHDAFADEPLTEREAFLWMVSEAEWKPHTRRVGKYTADLERGQLLASVRFMAGVWQWSKSRVGRFIKRLEHREMISLSTQDYDATLSPQYIGTRSGTPPSIITVCNYDVFQPKQKNAGQSAGQKRDSSGTVAGQTLIREEGKKKKVKDSCAFSDFWAVYPRRLGKKAAAAKFSAEVKSGVSSQHLINAAVRYAAHVTENSIEEKYVKHPTTWLNQGCWDDELKPVKTRRPADDRFARKIEVARRLDARREADSGMDNGASGSDVVALLPAGSVG